MVDQKSHHPRFRHDVKSDGVFASHGTWSVTRDSSGNIAQITGHFKDVEDALGTVAHLRHSKMTRHYEFANRYNFPREETDGPYIVKLVAHEHDDIGRFLEFADHHKLLPDAKKTGVLPTPEEPPVLAYRPGEDPLHLVEQTIPRLNWRTAGGPQENYLVTDIANPKVAFEVAFYLREKGMVSEQDFWRINEEIKYAGAAENEEGFRLAISPEHADKFNRQFSEHNVIKPGSLKPALDRDWVNNVARLASPIRR